MQISLTENTEEIRLSVAWRQAEEVECIDTYSYCPKYIYTVFMSGHIFDHKIRQFRIKQNRRWGWQCDTQCDPQKWLLKGKELKIRFSEHAVAHKFYVWDKF